MTLPFHVNESVARLIVLVTPRDSDLPAESLLLRARLLGEDGDDQGLPDLAALLPQEEPRLLQSIELLLKSEAKKKRGETPFDDTDARLPLYLLQCVDCSCIRSAGAAYARGEGMQRVYPVRWRLYTSNPRSDERAQDDARRLLGRPCLGVVDLLRPPASELGVWDRLSTWGSDDLDRWQEEVKGWVLDSTHITEALGLQENRAPSRDDMLIRSDYNCWLDWSERPPPMAPAF